MIGLRSAVLIGIIAVGVIASAIFISGMFSSGIPTKPTISENQAIEIAEQDLRDRVSGVDRVLIYPRDSPQSTGEKSLPLFYLDNKDILHRIDARNSNVLSSCNVSEGGDCFTTNTEIHDLVRGKLVYFIDGSWHAEDGRSSPMYYYIDAGSGKIIFSYIGEDAS